MTAKMSHLNENSPVRYCFFMTGNDPWLKLAKDLHDTGLATPVLWLGDDRHHARAKEVFGDAVVRGLDFVHRPFEIPNVEYSGEYSEFFETDDYLNTKDICLKMMDRLDLNGTFSRIDREAYFHKLLIWALNFFYDKRPQALIMIEKPHSHAQYLIFAVARYLEIPVAHFKDCSLMPVNFLQKEDGGFVGRVTNIDTDLFKRFADVVDEYVGTIENLATDKSNFTPHYIVEQQNKLRFTNLLKRIVSNESVAVLRDAASDLKFLWDRRYRATNPYQFLFLSRLFIKKCRQRNLRKAALASVDRMSPGGSYFYFPLHYEPERTTNPDGELYHDQFKALVLLRHFLPKNINILVKEHPSQFLMADRGSRGRSPLFYQLVKNIKGISIVGPDTASFDLLRNSVGVATITGSAALEAALLGKQAIIFGQAWFVGCPNVMSWCAISNYQDFSSRSVASTDDIKNFLVNLINDYGVPMVNNGGQLNAYRGKWYDDFFISCQIEGMKELINEFFKHNVVNDKTSTSKSL